MTREQAIKTIQGLYNQQGIDALTKDEMTALEMAIQALQAQADIEEILKDFSDELRADAERQTLNTISGVNIAITRMNRILHKFPTVAQADGDLISRSEAIEFFKYDVYIVNELKNMASVAIPSATGHWEEVGEEYIQVYDLNGIPSCGDERICSECGFETVFIGEHCSQYKFCPNCGCRMVEPQESEGAE